MLALPPLAAETIFQIGPLPVTNTYINSTIVLVLFLILGLLLRKRTAEVPGKLQNFVESVFEVLLGYSDRVTHDRKKSLRFFPLVGSLFFFILISNWLGIFPGIGSIGRWLVVHGEAELVPLFRPANTDLNMTLAMAVLGVVASHVFGVVAIGFWKYANKFVKLGDIWHSFRKGGISIFVAVVEFGVGLIEIFSEVAKMVSLSLRLFGNVFAGEVLLTVMASLLAFIVPLPFIALEVLVGLIQAVVFAMLVLVYLTVATMEVEPAH
ncbi:MAG: ATP synthase subunit a [Parcubacteria group bacterium GW2011_GWA2_51_12]|nr:MAG: ATP synthase subunit a [Parcubacteria group bacterium GW2011_GWA2_51_12]